MKQPLLIILGSALLTAAVIKAAPAFAEPATEQDVSIVRTADLDLSTGVGQRTLNQRLVIAAHEVCGTASDADLAGKNSVRICRANVLADARAKGSALTRNRDGKRTILVAASR